MRNEQKEQKTSNLLHNEKSKYRQGDTATQTSKDPKKTGRSDTQCRKSKKNVFEKKSHVRDNGEAGEKREKIND